MRSIETHFLSYKPKKTPLGKAAFSLVFHCAAGPEKQVALFFGKHAASLIA